MFYVNESDLAIAGMPLSHWATNWYELAEGVVQSDRDGSRHTMKCFGCARVLFSFFSFFFTVYMTAPQWDAINEQNGKVSKSHVIVSRVKRWLPFNYFKREVTIKKTKCKNLLLSDKQCWNSTSLLFLLFFLARHVRHAWTLSKQSGHVILLDTTKKHTELTHTHTQI